MIHKSPYIVCFGEVLWDVYPEGKKLGGAPFNVAAHVTQLGTQGHMVSKIGKDKNGEEILEAMGQQSVPSTYTVVDYSRGTGVVDVTLDDGGHPSYEIKYPAAWDFIHPEDATKELVKQSEAFVFGTLACRSERSRKTLFELIELAPLNICDLNIRLDFYSDSLISTLLKASNILKINDDEAALLIEMFDLDANRFYEQLTERFSIQTVIQTLGAKGAEVYAEGKLYNADAIKINVVDTVGSGDAFLATFIHYFIQKESIQYCLEKACQSGAFVATQKGAIPPLNEKIMERFLLNN